MAVFAGDNPFNLSGNEEAFQRASGGFAFEKEVGAELLRGLPDTYQLVWSTALKQRRIDPNEAPKEIDFVVVGPNGVFLIEAKNYRQVEGEFYGRWTFSFGSGAQERASAEVYRKYSKLTPTVGREAKERIGVPKGSEVLDLVRTYCVFPEAAKIKLYTDDQRIADTGARLRVVTLDVLADRIGAEPPPTVDKTPWLLTKDKCQRITREVFHSAARVENKDIVGGHWRMGEKRLAGPIKAPNGLKFFEYRMTHVEDTTTVRRGKLYDLSEGAKLKEYSRLVERHRKVGEALLKEPNISPCLEHFADEHRSGYWVLEQWREGSSLQEKLRQSWSGADLCRVVTQIAVGLHGLHSFGYYRRHLLPRSVFIEDGSGDVYLRDFEMVKIEGKPTVVNTTTYSLDPYVAPELERNPNVATAQADIYNWAAIFYELATAEPYAGELHRKGSGPSRLGDIGLPEDVLGLVRQCLRPFPQERPAGMDIILKTLSAWRI